jgi:integrase
MDLKRMWPSDFEEFGAWYSNRRKRVAGRPASAATVATKVQGVTTWSKIMECADHHELGTGTQDRVRVEQALDVLTATQTPSACRPIVYAVLSYGDWLTAKRIIAEPIALTRDDIPAPSAPRLIETYTDEEVQRLVANARGRGLRWWAFMTYLADTGRRLTETLNLRWTDLRLTSDPPHVVLQTTKSGRPMLAPLSTRLVHDVFTAPNIESMRSEVRTGRRRFNRSPESYPFPWTAASARERMKTYTRDVGVTYRGFHVLRHSLATRLLRDGASINAVSSLLGHSTPIVTARYYDHTKALDFRHLLG